MNANLLRFTWMRSHRVSKRLLETYLAQPDRIFLSRNGAELTAGNVVDQGSYDKHFEDSAAFRNPIDGLRHIGAVGTGA